MTDESIDRLKLLYKGDSLVVDAHVAVSILVVEELQLANKLLGEVLAELRDIKQKL